MRQTTIKSIVSAAQRDFFGIYDITSKDVAGAFANLVRLPYKQIDEKYDSLRKSRLRLSNEEKDTDEVFGRVRYDSDNLAQKHGQFEEDSQEPLYDTIQIKQMFVPDEENASTKGPTSTTQAESESTIVNDTVQLGNPPYKISEVEPIKGLNEVLQIFKSPNDEVGATLKYSRKPPLLFYFNSSHEQTSQIFSLRSRVKSSTKINAIRAEVSSSFKQEAEHKQKTDLKKAPKEPEISVERPQMKYDAMVKPQVSAHKLQLNPDKFDRSLDRRYDVAIDKPNEPMKASEYLKKVRDKEIEPSTQKLKQRLETTQRPYPLEPSIRLDSKGFRNYTDQVPNWNLMRRADVLQHLRNSIVYDNYDIIALNKPYGLASHGNPRQHELYDVNSLMGEIAKSMRIEKVYLTHRLDKTTTGILMFATSQERAKMLHKLFESDEIKKTYWCITRGVPNPTTGIVDMPIGEIEVSGKLRSCPAPVNLEDSQQLAKKFREARRAITEYQVIDSTAHAALVEVKPRSGVKHQIRCHLGFGLSTPILGDHKYSHLTKLAPQTLPPKMLNAFRIRQAKVRTLPMHLHAKSIVIPGAKANGETLFIHAPLPKHFKDNMETLKLSRGLKMA